MNTDPSKILLADERPLVKPNTREAARLPEPSLEGSKLEIPALGTKPLNGAALHKMLETSPQAAAPSVIFAPVCTGGVQTNHISPEDLTGTRDIVADMNASKAVVPAMLDIVVGELKKWLEKNPRVLLELGEQVLSAVNSQHKPFVPKN